MSDIDVSPPALFAAAKVWDGLADDAHAITTRLRTAASASGQLGLIVDDSAREYLDAWMRHSEKQASGARANADLLRQSAQAFVGADEEAAALLRTLLPWRGYGTFAASLDPYQAPLLTFSVEDDERR